MKLSDYNYSLPPELIAKHPPQVRGASKLLVLDKNTGDIEHKNYSDIIDYLNPGDVLVINNTKVIKARLIALDNNHKPTEIFLLEKHSETDDHFHHTIIYRGNLQTNKTLTVGPATITITSLSNDGTATIKSSHDLDQLAQDFGSVPLPPYLKREATSEDESRYQTVFAEHNGSVAAPTASLNMTAELMDKIHAKGIIIAPLTLHVGLGTFAPIRTDDLTDHHMHQEYFSIPAETITKIRTAKQHGNKIIALGTTVTRALEYSHHNILSTPEIQDSRGEADIFIYPGYQFKVVDCLITNFHAPKSTVLMLAAAFAGKDNLFNAYKNAVEHNYGFLSYGDSMLIR
ncbi:MAG: tRNA preQ1(34) S-adenosylmethionine ribosyltransferase-isomerase QueA [Patescibacteria group bacterium]